MKITLIDAGPIIALFRKRDKHHQDALRFIKNYKGRLITTWPVVSEVMYELAKPDIQENFLLWIERGGLDLANLDQKSVSGLLALIRKYSELPMDLADATLMLYSDQSGITEIATIDSDFNVCRNFKKEYLKNIFLAD